MLPRRDDEEITEACPKTSSAGTRSRNSRGRGEGLLSRARATGGTGYALDEAAIAIAQAASARARDHLGALVILSTMGPKANVTCARPGTL